MSEIAKKIMEKRQQLNKLVADVRAVMDTAETEKRAMTAEERSSITTMEADIDKLDSEIGLEERQLERERKLKAPEAKPQDEGGESRSTKPRESTEYRSAFDKYLIDSKDAMYTPEEHRAMQADNAIAGGMFMAPMQFVAELLRDIDNANVITGLARVFPINNSEGLGVPTLDNDVDDADWTPEIKAVTETQDLNFGKRELRPHQLTKLAKLSNKLIGGSTMDIESLVRERLSYKFGATTEKVFMLGDGNQKPLGLFYPSSLGIGTDKDISGSNTDTDIKADTLFDALLDLKEGYQKNATWLFSREAVKRLRKTKDANGAYIWNAAISGGQPATILERPYVTSEYCPNTFTTGQYVGMVGDFKYFWIAKRFDLAIQVLKELFSLTNQTGYIGRMEIDAMPVMSAAFRRIKLK